MGDNDDNWHYTFGLEENSGWTGHNGQIPGYFTVEVCNPELDATIVIAMNSDIRTLSAINSVKVRGRVKQIYAALRSQRFTGSTCPP